MHSEPGCSGSPLLNKQGEVTGVVFGRAERDSLLYKSITVAVPSDRVKALLAKPLEPLRAPGVTSDF